MSCSRLASSAGKASIAISTILRPVVADDQRSDMHFFSPSFVGDPGIQLLVLAAIVFLLYRLLQRRHTSPHSSRSHFSFVTCVQFDHPRSQLHLSSRLCHPAVHGLLLCVASSIALPLMGVKSDALRLAPRLPPGLAFLTKPETIPRMCSPLGVLDCRRPCG